MEWRSGAEMRDAASSQEEEVESLIRHAHETGDLDLSCRQLQQPPASLSTCACLISLSLSANCLSDLPASICSLQQLLSLDVSYNQLTSLPTQLGALTRLQVLNAAYNHLTSVPQQLTNLIDLQELRLNDNQLTQLPGRLAQQTSLQVLHIQYNQLTSLPPGLLALKSLTDISYEGNPIRHVTNPSHTATECSRPASSSSASSSLTCTPGMFMAGTAVSAVQLQVAKTGASLVRHAPDVLVLGGGDEEGEQEGEQRRWQGLGLKSPNRVTPAEPGSWQQANADECLDLEGPGIDLVGIDHSSPRQGPPGEGKWDGEWVRGPETAIQQAMEELVSLPPACAAVLYRTLDAVQTGVQEMQTGRPLTRGGTAPSGQTPLPRTAGRSPASSSGLRPESASVRPSTSSIRYATASQASGRPGSSSAADDKGTGPRWQSSGTTLSGVSALLAGPPRPGTASGVRPGTAVTANRVITDSRSQAAGGKGIGTAVEGTSGAVFQGLPPVTFPFTAGVRSMMRQLSGGHIRSKVPGIAQGKDMPGEAAAAGQLWLDSPENGQGKDVELQARPQTPCNHGQQAAGRCGANKGERDGQADDALETVRLLLASRNPGLLQGLNDLMTGDDDR